MESIGQFIKNYSDLENKTSDEQKDESCDEDQSFDEDHESEMDDEDDCEKEDQMEIDQDESQAVVSKLSLLKILRHYAAYTKQKQAHMTYLLKLLETHKPEPRYSMLPNTGRELVKIDGRDCASSGSSTQLPPVIRVGTGKYVHFGLEAALNGESAGLVHRDSLQFVDIYVDEPSLLPKPIIKTVICVMKF